MRTRRGGRAGTTGRTGRTGWKGWMGRTGATEKMLLVALALAGRVHAADAVPPADPALPALPASSPYLAHPAFYASQVSFEAAINDLASPDTGTRLRAVQLLKKAAYPEAALPLAALVTDAQDQVQLEAIAAELNIFLAEPVVPKKRVALVVEVRGAVQAEPAFSAGPSALGPLPVPPAVLTALRTAARDDNPRVAIEALYAFGVLAIQPGGDARRALLGAAGSDVAAFIGSSDPAMRFAAVRVLGRVFAKRNRDEPIESTIGDAVITALNDNDRVVKAAAMQALGTMRYDRGVQALTDLFTYYGKGDAAEAALDALARIAHPTSVPLFTAQLASKTAALRAEAIEGLARVGDASQLSAIQAVIDKERDARVTLAGAFALVLLGNGPTDQVADSLSRPRLRDQAKGYLIEIAPGRTAAFAHQLLDSDPQLRADTIDALGLAGDPAAIPVLQPLTEDRDAQVARAAERAVARLRAAQR
jgi:HEAT repeat protein